MDSRALSATILAASIAVLGGALLFQYVGGLAPCDMCLWQRWPYAVAIVLAALAIVAGGAARRLGAALPAVFALVFAIGLALGLYHVAVEQHWVTGPTACSSPLAAARSVADLQRMILERPVVRCDEVPWSLLGVSLAGFNAIFSALLAALALHAAVTVGRGRRR
ncbi:MAG: disulfide bond formation protein B [Alphaproteobacteria bacterium]|nr:disulfide bond formation protein B [Alphaproteobacteria bacterium]